MNQRTILRPKKATAVMMKKNTKTQLSSQDTKALHSVLQINKKNPKRTS